MLQLLRHLSQLFVWPLTKPVVSTEPANALAEKDTPMSVQPVKRGRKAADASAAPPSEPDVPAATDQAGDASTSTEPATAGTPMPVEPVKRGTCLSIYFFMR